jgi:PilZ domain
MNRMFDGGHRSQREEVASLATDIRVRVLNVSGVGCLIETRRALEVGTVATLRINFAGGDFEDSVQIVRCQEISGAGAVFHLGAAFLTIAAPSIESLRYLIRRQSGPIGYIRLTDEATKGEPRRPELVRTTRSRQEMETGTHTDCRPQPAAAPLESDGVADTRRETDCATLNRVPGATHQ